jgi:single-strand DNA-binding protein
MYQTIILVGNLGRDPELRYLASNNEPVCDMSVATNRTYNDVKETTWFKVTAWGKTAENCAEYLSKGSKVLIEGRLTPDKKTGGPRIYQRQDGSYGASFEVTAMTVRFLSSKGDSNDEPQESQKVKQIDPATIPF